MDVYVIYETTVGLLAGGCSKAVCVFRSEEKAKDYCEKHNYPTGSYALDFEYDYEKKELYD